MFAKRAQGRPCRGESEVGRNRIIEGIRSIVRSGACTSLSRKELALHIGVTPALITYYFPKKESLIYEVARPVMLSYRNKLKEAIDNDHSNETKLRNMISILLDLYGKDGRIMQMYALNRTPATGVAADEMDEMTAIISEFFFSWRGDQRTNSFHAAVLQGAVRGMCEFAARVEGKEAQAEQPPVTSETQSEWLEPLLRLFTTRVEAFGSLMETNGRSSAAGLA